ncbi:MAG: cysteine desulfurase, partial [Planctomycetaceae bacterium]|nr:cysteine desulfurase [Planctomycetaceae bacterium]
MSARIYLDNNATTRPWPEVIETVAYHLQHSYANPGSRHAEGRQARKVLESSRETIASILGAQPDEVIFTSGGTEASNLALFGAANSMTPGTIALTAGEHPATIESCKSLKPRGWELTVLPVDHEGRLLPLECGVSAPLWIAAKERGDAPPHSKVKLATVILAHNETGVIQDARLLAAICREHGVFCHIDAVQAVGKIDVGFAELGATSLAFGAHKFHGPRGIGGLLLRKGATLAPFEFGGHQESGRRPGTEMVALAAGMAKALELWHRDRHDRTARLKEFRDRLEAGLLDRFPWAVVNGSREHRLPNTLNIAFPGLDGEAILVNLDLEGIACSLGSTCASGSAEPAPALVAMG